MVKGNPIIMSVSLIYDLKGVAFVLGLSGFQRSRLSEPL